MPQKSFVWPKYPELIFGIAGPIGIDIDEITRELGEALRRVGYRSSLIKITDEIADVHSGESPPENPSFFNVMKYKMAHASAICREREDAEWLMKVAVDAIRRERAIFVADPTTIPETPDDYEESVHGKNTPLDDSVFDLAMPEGEEVAFRSAFIIRQIKRPQEVRFLRNLYGSQFILISAYGSRADRQKALEEKIRATSRAAETDAKISFLAGKLIESDMNEDRDTFGQHMRDTFHLADVVIDGLAKPKIAADLERFVAAFFGSNQIAPTRAEYGMNLAAQAALRSSDLSRQIGAVVFSPEGHMLTQGCNEVPKSFGGTYWDSEQPDFRDVILGADSNDILKMTVLRDLFDKMKRAGLLPEEITKLGSADKIAEHLVGRGDTKSLESKYWSVLKGAQILDLTEYGRVVHAEMSAICDAARAGVSLKGGVLFTTTFPCHNCTKHVLASGISKVFFLEPYPKSKAEMLHQNEISVEKEETGKVSFLPFKGITPQIYRRIFSKGKRKRDGRAVRWQAGSPAPIVRLVSAEYLRIERFAAASAYEPSDKQLDDASSAEVRV